MLEYFKMHEDVLDPEFATAGSACFDVSSYLGPPVYTERPPNLVTVHTRSSVSLKQGLVMANSEGIIDSDYYHQCFIMIYNASADEIRIKHKERIAQGELIKTLDYSLKQTTIQPERTTERVGGLGSTGQ